MIIAADAAVKLHRNEEDSHWLAGCILDFPKSQ